VVVSCLPMMSVSEVSMVGGLFVVPALMMLRRFMMMFSGVFVVFRSMGVMLCCLFRM